MTGIKSQPPVDFAYRHNDDDSWDAICLHCFLTVGTASRIDVLAEVEALHNCYERSHISQKTPFRDPMPDAA
jgi:hypothetical protein